MKLLLLSGGVDSTALAYQSRPDVALTIDYGQIVAKSEILAARAICSELQVRHLVLRCDCSNLGRGTLRGTTASVLSQSSEWWPYRNQILITFAAGAMVDEAPLDILIGTVRGDGRQHLDGTKRFIKNMNSLLACQEGQVRVLAPYIDLTTKQVLDVVDIPKSILGWTFSCNTSELPCGACRACQKRREVLDL